MASSEAWGQGWALGSQIAGEQRQHKQALSDEEFQQKASDLVENRKAIQAKLPTLLDENGKPTPEYNQAINDLTANAHDLRELYHPDKNPGMIAKYGHILTDSLHLTNAKDREQKAEAKQEAGAASDKYSALSWAGAAPISPAQTAAQQTTAEIAADKAKKDANIQWLKDHDAPQEVIDSAIAHLGGVTSKDADDVWTNVKNAEPEEYPKGSGEYRVAQVNKKGEFRYEKMPDGYVPPPPKATKLSNIDEERESYRKTHGIPAGQPLTFDQEKDFVKQMALARNPFGPARLQIAEQGLGLREQESGFRDFLSLQKQLSPIERVISTASETPGYVASPTGPGDVALTLAFFDAIKTTGVRFTKQEQDFIIGSRGFMEGVQAKFDQGYEGTVFGPPGSPQRALIAGIVKKAGDTAAQQKGTLMTGAGAFDPKAAAAAGGGAPKHKIKIGNKFYTYNGTGDTADLKNYTEVPK